MKKKIYLTALFVCLIAIPSFAEESDLINNNQIQTRIDSIGTNILNHNNISKRMAFTYDSKSKKKLLSSIEDLTNRQIIVYKDLYQFIQTDDELAASLSREIATTVKSYDGDWGGWLDSAQVALGSKKFETVADKRAVDYMVNAGYNPLALIVLINKTCPQKRHDRFSRHNLTSKRLARIYEYITFKYPEYLENNEYLNNKYYQNFLLTSQNNRRMLENKIKTKSTEELKYE